MKKFLLLILAFQFYAYSGIAQWSGDPSVADTKVIVRNSQQHGSHIIPDGSGGSIIFWIDERGSGYDIYYNRLNSAGVAVWASTSEGVRLTNNFSDYNDINQVISDGNGGAFIMWDNGGQLWLQHIDNTGAKVWPFNMLLVDGQNGSGEDGFMCSDGEGGFIVAWSSYDSGNDEYQTYAQRISEDGSTYWYEPGSNGVRAIAGTGSRKPMGIVSDGDGGAIIIMEDARNSSYDDVEGWYDNMDIFAQRINRYGLVEWGFGGMPVTTATGNQSRYGTQPSYVDYKSYGQGQQHPCVISDGAGGVIIAWEDYRDDPENGNSELNNNGDIYCQRLDPDGVSLWGNDGKVLCDENGDQYAVSLMSDGNGGAVVAWVDRRYNSHYIYAQNIDENGGSQWDNNGNEVSNEINGINYTITSNLSNSAMLLSWATLNNSDYEIRSQKIVVADGTLAWGDYGIVVCSVQGSKVEPVISHAGSSGAIIAWTDERNSGTTNLDIYAGLVVDGALPVTLITFGGQLKNNDVVLQWKTSSEQKAGHFIIEHSLDGISFSKKGSVAASGNTSRNNYAFTDMNIVKGVNFYRLKIVDTDGRFKYSKTIRIITALRNVLQIFPNPVRDVLNLQVLGEHKNGLIQIFDLSGKKVQEQKIFIAGNTTRSIDISHLPNGIYNIIFTNQKNKEQIKFVKQ